jgi:molybdenum cofactor synthesis domain-containing protein
VINAAVLTISDSACAGTRPDLSGPGVRERLEQLGWSVSAIEVLPDEADLISARLATLADGNQFAAIFTTGGTGVAVRDVTPEATRAVIEREIPGIGELMRSHGRKSTPLAALSRALAGIRGRVLIVNLPGSPRAAVESLDGIIDVVPHILQLLRGETEHAADTKRQGR